MKILKFNEFVNEVQVTFDNQTFYHGSSNQENAEKAIKDEYLKPGNEDNKRGRKGTPEIGRVYMTQNLHHALIYTIGGDYLGSEISDHILKNEGQFGYLFVIDSKELGDVDPDEDYVGELIYMIGEKEFYLNNKDSYDYEFNKRASEWDENTKQSYLYMAKNYLTPRQYQKCLDYNDYMDFPPAGKKLNKVMGDLWKKRIIDLGVPIANYGKTKFKEVWKFDKTKSEELKKDGSNFFDLAEKIDLNNKNI